MFGDIDALLIINTNLLDLNFFKFTKLLESGIFEHSAAIVFNDGRRVVVTSLLEERAARRGKHTVITYKRYEEFFDILAEVLKNSRKIGINGSFLPYNLFKKIEQKMEGKELVDVSQKLQEIRMVKDGEELKMIREAAKIASEVAEDIPEFVKEGMSEKELAAEIVYNLQKNGANSIAFDPIVAFGSNAGEPHYMSGDRKLKRGDVILADFGAKYNRYCSDITRTFFFGKADEEFHRAYEIVLEAQKRGIRSIREGVTGDEVDRVVREYIDSTEFKGKFIHSTGHGIGLDVHDHAALTPNLKIKLLANMVLTVEPGIYTEDFGIRIEDDVIVKKDGCEVITHAPKDLIEI